MTALPPIGSFGVVRTNGFPAWVIRRVTRSKFNHALVYVGDMEDVEAKPHGSIESAVSDYPGIIWHPYVGTRGVEIAYQAMRLQGRGYGWLDILYVGLLQYHIRLPFLRRRIANTGRLICSQLVDLAYHNAGIELFVDCRWQGDVTPGDLAKLPIA